MPVEVNSDEEMDPSNSTQSHPSTSISASTNGTSNEKTVFKKKLVSKTPEPNRHWRKREVATSIPPYSGKPEGK